MSEIQQMFNPPRMPSVPQAPLPQTTSGVLEHSGLPYSDSELVTDVPPDFGWMCELQAFVGIFSYSKNDEVGSELKQFSVNAPDFLSDTKMYESVPIWQHIPFTCSKWFNATIGFKFEAVCPPRVTGKLLIRYDFLLETHHKYGPNFDKDKLKRGICKEWDIGQSNIFEFDVTALCPIQARPTWIPERSFAAGSAVSPYAPQMIHPSITHFGCIRIEVAQYLQPGSIFPDSIRILMFRSIKNANFYTPTDPRSGMSHVLTRPWPVKPRPHIVKK